MWRTNCVLVTENGKWSVVTVWCCESHDGNGSLPFPCHCHYPNPNPRPLAEGASSGRQLLHYAAYNSLTKFLPAHCWNITVKQRNWGEKCRGWLSSLIARTRAHDPCFYPLAFLLLHPDTTRQWRTWLVHRAISTSYCHVIWRLKGF